MIAAITSCTNTSNPQVMIAAGLLAKKAVELGLTRAAVGEVVARARLARRHRLLRARRASQRYLDELGFNTVGYGCTTCIGNSGPLPRRRSRSAIADGDLVACAVLSGNRNFEARIHPEVKANYLASPPLVVAYALAGRMDIDLETEPLARPRRRDVYLRDLWPTSAEIQETIASAIQGEMFSRDLRRRLHRRRDTGGACRCPTGDALRLGSPARPTCAGRRYLEGMTREHGAVGDIDGARCLVSLGDSVTTDHISPAGSIRPDSPAGRYLIEHGVEPRDFNSYGSRRGNHEVMVRGTFANVRLRNLLVPGSEGTWTVHVPSGEEMTIFDAAERYLAEGTPLIVLAGKEYGSGSSRDWAAKGPLLLGVRAVIAESYERIHRSNLLMMGVLPLQFLPGESRESLGLTGREEFAIAGVENGEAREVTVRADGSEFARDRPPRHAARARVPAPRRHPPVRRPPPAANAPRGHPSEIRAGYSSARRTAGMPPLASGPPYRFAHPLPRAHAARTLRDTGVPRSRLRSHPSNLIRIMPAKGGRREGRAAVGNRAGPARALRVLGLLDGFLLWANLSVSLLVIVAGAFLVLPASQYGLALSLPEALGAIVAAALVGNLMLAPRRPDRRRRPRARRWCCCARRSGGAARTCRPG